LAFGRRGRVGVPGPGGGGGPAGFWLGRGGAAGECGRGGVCL
jgi:hypothetical protein